MAIERVSGVLLGAAEAEFLVHAIDHLRRAVSGGCPELDDIAERLRRALANATNSRLGPRDTTANANFLQSQADSAHAANCEWITSAQAGQILGRTADAVRAAARRGKLPHRRRGGRYEFDRRLIEQRAERTRFVWPL